MTTVYQDAVTPLDAAHMNALQQKAEKAAANGYASLDGTGKVPAAQLPPSSSLTYRGAYNPATVYADGDTVVGADGVTYMCMIGGTVGVTPSPWAPWSVAVPTVVNGQWLKGVGGAAVWTPITPADISGYPADGTKALFGDGTWKAPTSARQIALMQFQAPNNTSGAANATGAWTALPLNTIVSDAAALIVSLAANQFTLAPGTYMIRAWQSVFSTYRTRVRLYNVTAAAPIVYGLSTYGENSPPVGPTVGLEAPFTLAAQSVLAFQYWCQSVGNLGLAVNSGAIEVYCNVLVEKVG